MDHLKTPANPVQRVSVRYYGGKEYDGLGFFDYPMRRGLDGRSLRSLTPTDLEERVTCKGAIAYFEKILRCMLSTTKERYGQQVFEYLHLLKVTYKAMCQDVNKLGTDNSHLPAMSQIFSQLPLDAAQKTRLNALSASWLSACRAGKPVEQFTIEDAHAFFIDILRREYETKADPNVNSYRATFILIQEKIKVIQKIAMLVPDDAHLPLEFYKKFTKKLAKFSWRRQSLRLPWFHSEADIKNMILFSLSGSFDSLPGDFDYDGGDLLESLNWTTNFDLFHTKQLQDQKIVRFYQECAFKSTGKGSGVNSFQVLSYRYWDL